MAHTVDEVWAQCQDILTALNALNDLHPIKVKLDALSDPAKAFRHWIDCDKCHGEGEVLDFATSDGISPTDVTLPAGINPPVIVCPRCRGAKRFAFGWQETTPSEYP